ncbi:MAG: hypothetical protein J5I93_15780 [Pirellulaceae bacterium]|nr:hypothetical protein [Pirellulaceae bacterium]
MQDSFNPYHEWLGLELDQREPDFYQLLGIGSETRDTAEIAAAANRAITRVRSHRPGPRAAAWAQLLDQLAEAKRRLSDPDLRAQYDAHLGRGTSPPPPVAVPRAAQETLDYIPPVSQAPTGLYPPVPRNERSERSERSDGSDRNDRWASPPSSAVVASGPALVNPPTAAAPLPAHDPMAPYDPDAPAVSGPSIWSEPQVPAGTAWNVPSEARADFEPTFDAAHPASAAPAAWPAATPYESAYAPGAEPVGASPQVPVPVGTLPMGSVPMGTVPMGTVPMGSVPMGSVPMGSPVGSTWTDQSPPDPMLSDSVAPSAAKKSVRARRSQSSSLGFMALGAISLAVLLGVLYLAARNRWSAVPVAAGPGPAAGVGTSQSAAGNWPNGMGAGSGASSGAGRPPATQPSPDNPPAGERPERMPSDADPTRPEVSPALPPDGPGTSPPAINDPLMPATEPPPIQPPAIGTSPDATSPDPAMPKPAVNPPATEKPPLTAEQLVELGRALTTARVALGEQSFDVAQEELAKAEQLARQPDHVAKLERLKLLAQYVEGFWDAVSQAVAGLEGTDEFTVGSTVVVVVEATPEKLVIKANGVRREYPVRQLPPGLAVAIADQWFDKTKPENLVFKGAYVAVMRNAKEDDLAKGRDWWQQAQAAGIDLSDLLPVLEDTYEFTAGD